MSGVDELQARSPRRLSLPFSPESVGTARHALDDWLDDSVDRQEFAADCRLVVSELVGNAVRHARPLAGGTVDVHWRCSDHELSISVTDGGAPSAPQVVDAPLDAPAGRGLSIVQALSHHWWVERSGARTTVHVVLSLA
jgi:anti-sigma regulatory factor (Ser/Thr protein kinase)